MDEIFACVDSNCEKRKKMGRTKNKEQGMLNYEVYALNNILPSTFLAPCSLFFIPYPPTPTRFVSSGPLFLFLC
jgi:hypothetical protein